MGDNISWRPYTFRKVVCCFTLQRIKAVFQKAFVFAFKQIVFVPIFPTWGQNISFKVWWQEEKQKWKSLWRSSSVLQLSSAGPGIKNKATGRPMLYARRLHKVAPKEISLNPARPPTKLNGAQATPLPLNNSNHTKDTFELRTNSSPDGISKRFGSVYVVWNSNHFPDAWQTDSTKLFARSLELVEIVNIIILSKASDNALDEVPTDSFERYGDIGSKHV